MAQQQQTVLRVQTNILDDTITVQSGYTSVVTGDTFGISYSGTGTSDDPYVSSNTTGYSEFHFTINGRNGILFYQYSGASTLFLDINGDTIRYNSNRIVSGTINVYEGNVVAFRAQNPAQIIGMYFVENEEVVYKNEFLDLYGDIPIKINKSFAELQDISKRNSDYSIGLQLPGSKKNNRFFESFFNVDVDTLYFNPLTRVPCSVMIDDQSYFSGYLKLNKISVLNSKVEYDVTLFSNVADLFGKIGNNLLKDLNFNDQDHAINHEFNKYEVQNWDYNPFSRDEPAHFIYPIVHNGYNYTGDTVQLSGGTVSGQTRLYTSTIVGSFANNAAAYAAGVKRYRLNSPQDGLLDNQLKPALNVLNLIQLMFKSYGYTIDSDFFNTPWFKMLYVYGYFSSDTTKFSYKTPVPQTLGIDGVNVILVETYIDTTQICLGSPNIRTDRTYTIYVVKAGTGIPCLCSDPITIGLDFELQPCTGPNSPYTVSLTIPANSTGTTYSWVSNQFVDCGGGSCVIEIIFNYGLNESASDVSESPEPLAYAPVTPNTTLYYEEGDDVDFSLVIDPNIKQIDFLSSIAKKFNLVFVPNPNNPTELKIEPYSYYIGTGNIYDWTDKISYDKGFTVEPAQNYVESELILTEQEDGDYGNKTFKDQNNRIYGQNFVYNSTDFKSQTKKIDTIFSPELLRQWDTPDTAPNGNIKLPLGINYAASSNSQSSGGTEKVTWQYKGVKTKPKLFYNLGFFNPFLDTLGEIITFSGYVLTNQVYIAASDGTNPRGRFVVPIVSHTMPIGNDDANKINNDSISVLFNSEQPVDLGVTPFDVYTENDSYNLFYSNRINNLYNKNTRFINGYFDLKLSDIQNLRANDIIRIKDQYFTWNKINSFNLTSPELTKVELIQFNNQVNTYPVRYFKYYYCDNPSVVFKFKTDMTNPSLSGTSYGWSVFYDYSIGVLANDNVTPLSGFTSSVRDIGRLTDPYIPYTIYEVTEQNYNASGIDRQYDTLWDHLIQDTFDGGDLNQTEWPSYIYANSGITYNLFEDCANFTSAAAAYGITTGSSTYYGSPVVPTPTPTVTPMPTPTPEPMIGSLLMTFDELVDDRGGDYYQVYVNSILRDFHFTDTENLYSTYLNIGDVVEVVITDSEVLEVVNYSVIRLDYTTDDEGNDMGIKEVTPAFTVATGSTFTTISFTASTVSNAYDFYYKINANIIQCINIGSGFTGEYVSDMILQPDGKLLLTIPQTGQTYSGISIGTMVRLNTDLTIDNTFSVSPVQYSTVWEAFGLQSTGKIVAGSQPTYSIVRLNSNGSIDNTFNSGSTNSSVYVTKVQSDDKIIVAGAFTTYSGQSYNRIVRLNANGTIDNTFVIGSGFANNFVYDIDIQSDGKILVAGDFTSYSGASYNGLVRLNTNGSIDTTFVIGTGFNNSVNDVNVLPDGKILCGGMFSSYNGTAANDIIRLNSDGSVDASFVTGSGFSGGFLGFGTIFAMAIQSDGKALIGGYFTTYSGQTENRIIRLNTDGSNDTSFNNGTGFLSVPTDTLTAVYDIALTPTGQIYVCGRFNTYNGQTVGNFIKLTDDGNSMIC